MHARGADALQTALEQRAQLDYTAATLREIARTTKSTAQRLRMGLAGLALAQMGAGAARELGRVVRRGPAAEPRPAPGQRVEGQYGVQNTGLEGY